MVGYLVVGSLLFGALLIVSILVDGANRMRAQERARREAPVVLFDSQPTNGGDSDAN